VSLKILAEHNKYFFLGLRWLFGEDLVNS